MSLRILPDLIQGTEEWNDQRRGMVTASVVDRLLTATLKVANNDTSRALTMLLTAERLTGHTDPTWRNDDMMRGVFDEPIARNLYSQHYAPVEECGFMVRNDWGFEVGYSPDGLVGDVGLIEVKSRRQKNHLETVLDGEIPAANMAQIQCGLLVSGRAWCDYVSFCGGMHLWTKRVYPNTGWHEAIVNAVRAFEAASAEITDKYLAAVDGLPMTERISFDEVDLKL